MTWRQLAAGAVLAIAAVAAIEAVTAALLVRELRGELDGLADVLEGWRSGGAL